MRERLLELVTDPGRAADLDPEEARSLFSEALELNGRLGVLLSNLLQPKETGSGEGNAISGPEAGRILGVSESYLYQHGERMGIAHRIGRRVVFSRWACVRWRKQRMAA
jgi:hypothetical protein